MFIYMNTNWHKLALKNGQQNLEAEEKNVISQIVKYHLDYITCKIGKQIGFEALCTYSAGHLQTSEFKLVEYYTCMR